jgi:arylsulfatase A-like enzyme
MPSGRSERPNIVFIVTDDQRQLDTMDAMPQTRRWFEDGGTRFPRAITTTPVCCPSRASILSGRYSHNHGVLHNEGRGELDLDTTIQRRLQEAGYKTALVGKFLNYWDTRNVPPHFDWWRLMSGLYSPLAVNEQGNFRSEDDTYSTTYLRERALEFIRTETPGDQPWFLYLATSAPHQYRPHVPPIPDEMYEKARVRPFKPRRSYMTGERSDKPPWVRTPRWPHDRIMEEYRGTMRALLSVDDMVEAIFQELEQTGQADDTLAVYTTDHGFLWGEHGQVAKGSPYLEGVHVPLYMRWPAEFAGGRVDDRLVGNVDLAATAASVAGIEMDTDGRSLVDTDWERDRILIEYWSVLDPNEKDVTFYSTLGRDYQYTEWYEEDGETPRLWPEQEPFVSGPVREYYDLARDPFQLYNLLNHPEATDEPDVEALSAQLALDRRCKGHGPPGSEPPPSP